MDGLEKAYRELQQAINVVLHRKQASTVNGMPRSEYYRKWRFRNARSAAYGRNVETGVDEAAE